MAEKVTTNRRNLQGCTSVPLVIRHGGSVSCFHASSWATEERLLSVCANSNGLYLEVAASLWKLLDPGMSALIFGVMKNWMEKTTENDESAVNLLYARGGSLRKAMTMQFKRHKYTS